MIDLKFVTVETFIVQFIVLIVILWVLNKFLFKPYLEYLDEWENKHEKLENDYNHIDDLIHKAEEKKKKILKEAREHWKKIEDDAQIIAKQVSWNLLEKASKEATAIIKAAKEEIKQEKKTMLNSMKSKVINLALKLNQKLFDKEKVSKDYLEKNIDSI